MGILAVSYKQHYRSDEQHKKAQIYSPQPIVVYKFEFGHCTPTSFVAVVVELIYLPAFVTQWFVHLYQSGVYIVVGGEEYYSAAVLFGFGVCHH